MNGYRFLLPLLLAFGLTLGLAACSGSDEAGEAAPPGVNAPAQRTVRVETIRLQPQVFEDVIELTASVEAPDDAMLSAQSAGTVTMLAALGRTVAAGQAVAQLDAGLLAAGVSQAEAVLETARAQLNLAQDLYDRQEPLYQDSIISALEFQNVSTQLNQAKAQVRQSEAMLNQANEQLKYTRVVAPFTGIVEEHFVERGEQVSPGMPVARVVNTRRVIVRAGVPERFAGEIEVGTPVEVRFNNYTAVPRNGRVTFTGSVINPENRTFSIEVELDNRDGNLKPEMIANVFVRRSVLTDQIVVPQTAVLRDEYGTSMFVVERGGTTATATRRTIFLGASYKGRAVVERGLAPGDEVIVVGQTKVTEGDAIEVVPSAPTTLPPTG